VIDTIQSTSAAGLQSWPRAARRNNHPGDSRACRDSLLSHQFKAAGFQHFGTPSSALDDVHGCHFYLREESLSTVLAELSKTVCLMSQKW